MRTVALWMLVACGTTNAPSEPPAVEVVAAPEVPVAEATEAPAMEAALAVVNAPDRAPKDTDLDAGRLPADLLVYYDVRPGMRVAEMMSGGGYTVELLARAVGPDGAVYGVNSTFVLERFAQESWTARVAKPVNANVTRFDREFDDPFPDDLIGLDRVFSVLVYHDFFWMETDRAAMNADIFRALKPGGLYAVLDHSAEAGSGARDVKTLHRVDQATVRAEVEAAGFEYVGESDLWRNPDDARDWSASPGAAAEKRGTSDRFAMTFRKPQ